MTPSGIGILSTVIEDRYRLQAHLWSDQEIRLIPTESLARSAFQSSESLRKQYLSEELFVAHWLGIRRRYRLIAQYDTEAAASLDQQLKKEWDSTPALQAEFNDNFSHCAAFVRADRQGAVRIAGRK